MYRFVFATLLTTQAFAVEAAIFTPEKHPSIQAHELGEETGRQGTCAVTSRIMLCITDWDFKAFRQSRRGGDSVESGTWEGISGVADPSDSNGIPRSQWIRVCVEGDCEVWPREVFKWRMQQ